jgi:hypothetical protein
MSRKRKRQGEDNQPELALTGEGFQGTTETRGLFSGTYLERHLPQSREFVSERDAQAVYELTNELVRNHLEALQKQNEAFTCSTFLEPLLDALGWRRIPQQSMPAGMVTRKRPDYCLLASDEAFATASRADATELFRQSATVLEAKKWGHPLDRLSQEETPGWFPSQQIQDYLNCAKDSEGKRFFDWAILTNGNEWRLYSDKSAVGAYFSFHLVREGQICSPSDFRLFFTLFRATAFDRTPEGTCFLDAVREQSLRVQAELENNLRKRIFGVLEDVGSAFVGHEENGLGENDYPVVYEKSLIFLYRLLFILYAESRGLLPVREYVPGANRRYLREFSLARLNSLLRDRTRYQDNAFCVLYEELLRLFNLINGTHPAQNASLEVTRYNGGLFNPRFHQEIERWRIGDRDLADILRQLTFSQPPARPRDAQGRLSTDETIDYSTLEVRQLGDIYEGLLGAHFEQVNGRLELRNENGENHRHGIFYTPDWIVRFLLDKSLAPLLAEIEATDTVQRALKARSEERRRDNSFALGVLRLNLVDPAMGSGHFLVRATEYLAESIMNHPTTQPMTMQIVAQGQRRITREEIVGRGKIPVSPGIPQEHAEKAYWRRRVVEACIHGVDINPLAVELAKLSLWLTCIAVDEPLNFLDHHLRHGNALLAVAPEELKRAPALGDEAEHATFDLGERLSNTLSGVISDSLQIESLPSTEMDDVKEKEQLWKEARYRLKPFLDLSNLWLAALDGVAIDEFNYLAVARLLLDDPALSTREKGDAKRFMRGIAEALAAKKADLSPFHWQLEFPDVFFDEDGQPLPPARRGFDAVLGNPPYVSIHTAMEPGNRRMRDALEKCAGYVEDLYVHFTDLGFSLLREGGAFGFIVSDTFFTLASKLRMREMLQSHALAWLGQCDPFDATVDAAIFVARKQPPGPDHRLCFVQARPLKRADGNRTKPEGNLEKLPDADAIAWDEESTPTPCGVVLHATEAELRVHQVPLALYQEAHKRVFFEPQAGTLHLFERFNTRVKELVTEWWEKIENSRVFSTNQAEIQAYHRTLRPGDITLVGLIAEGGQGMRTANNARFLAYLDGTPQAEDIKAKSQAWSADWLRNERIRPTFAELLQQAGGDPEHPTANRPAWETAVHGLRERFTATQLGFGRTSLFRIAPPDLVADQDDFVYAFQRRKAELLTHWQGRPELTPFWDDQMELDGRSMAYSTFREITEISDEDFCRLCQGLQRWVGQENARRSPSQRIPQETLGLRSSEDYSDPVDAPRIATIYNGLYGRAQFVPFRKGDPEGSRWLDNEPLYCEWTRASVEWLSTNRSARWQGHRFFLTPGVTWSLHANHVAAKCRYQEPCVFDASSSRLTPVISMLSAESFVAITNSEIFSFFLKKFIKHNQDIEINDMRIMPVPLPTIEKNALLKELATLAMASKRHEFAGTDPTDDLVSRVREIGERLGNNGPAYLRPSAQGLLLSGPGDCLEVIEKAVNWEAEKLYGVEGLGPFDEF